jgi:hypothetical protein
MHSNSLSVPGANAASYLSSNFIALKHEKTRHMMRAGFLDGN